MSISHLFQVKIVFHDASASAAQDSNHTGACPLCWYAEVCFHFIAHFVLKTHGVKDGY